MPEQNRDMEIEQFRGDYNRVLRHVRVRDFRRAAPYLLEGWGYETKPPLVLQTAKQLAAVWAKKRPMMRSVGEKTERTAEEVLMDVELWLDGLHRAGRIKKVADPFGKK